MVVEVGQVWASGERTVLVLAQEVERVVVRDMYGWRRSLTQEELQQGFRVMTDQPPPMAHVMARRALADVEPA